MMRDGYTADLPDCPSCTHLCTLFDLQPTIDLSVLTDEELATLVSAPATEGRGAGV